MKIYYNTTKQCLVDEFNCQTASKPILHFGEKPVWELQLFQGEIGSEPEKMDISHITAWRVAIDKDWSCDTVPMCRTPSGINKDDAATGLLKIPLNANTETFLKGLHSVKSINGFFEARGFDACGDVVIVIVFAVCCHNALDPEGGDLGELELNVAEKAWVEAILSQPLEWEYSADLQNWHRALMPDQDKYQRCRHGSYGVWSKPADIPYGQKGEQGIQGEPGPQGIQGEPGQQGERGAAFTIDATGTMSERVQYDSAEKGFSFLSTDDGCVYIKSSSTSGDWSAPIPFKGDKGDKPFNLKGVWVSGTTYAKDDAVTYNGSMFVAMTPTTAEPGSDDSWLLYVSQGTPGKDGDPLESNYIDIDGVYGENITVDTATVPVAVEINNSVYPITGMVKEDNIFKIPVAPILASANLASYDGVWRVWRAGGRKGDNGSTGGTFAINVVSSIPENPDPTALYLIPME